MIRVMVVDDSVAIRDGLTLLLATAPDMELVAALDDGDEARDAAEQTHPDVVLMDVTMERVDGLQATQQLLDARPQTRVVLLTATFSADVVRQAQRIGAVGFVLKGDDPSGLLDAIRGVAAGGTAWSTSAAACLASN